jgi:isopentenyl phosphate kinase
MDQQQKGIQSPAKLVVVKLGGAAVTIKDTLETLQVDALACTARQLAIVSTDTPCVVIHGAGSFGHHQASHYHVAQGGTDSLNVRKGFALTRYVGRADAGFNPLAHEHTCFAVYP